LRAQRYTFIRSKTRERGLSFKSLNKMIPIVENHVQI
jgi:hypothetical protein